MSQADHEAPHAGAAVLRSGADLPNASHALLLFHGRGATADDILGLGNLIVSDPSLAGFALLAPQAADSAWYPNSFLAPREQNEPWLSSALRLVAGLIAACEDVGISAERIALCGFSQGACLATEFVATYPRRYNALIALTGGLIGPPGADLCHAGMLNGTPVLFSSGDPDSHVPWQRVMESASVLREMGAEVKTLHHPDRPHTVLRSEIDAARSLLMAFR